MKLGGTMDNPMYIDNLPMQELEAKELQDTNYHVITSNGGENKWDICASGAVDGKEPA